MPHIEARIGNVDYYILFKKSDVDFANTNVKGDFDEVKTAIFRADHFVNNVPFGAPEFTRTYSAPNAHALQTANIQASSPYLIVNW